MIRIFVRRNPNLDYLTGDSARELEDLREGPAWWVPDGRGSVDFRHLDARLRTSSRSRVVGYDLVIAAPRPISILLALDETRAPDVVRAHREAVSSTLSYLDERAAVIRTRRAGHEEVIQSGFSGSVGRFGKDRHLRLGSKVGQISAKRGPGLLHGFFGFGLRLGIENDDDGPAFQ